MRTLLHLSDFHFGALDESLLTPLRNAAIDLKPDLTVISGDFTQRARAHQFRAAATFIATLPGQLLCVPGNHDVPLYNVAARFLTPLRNYRRFIDPNPEPFYEDDEITVLGINTARSLTIQDGRLNPRQIAHLRTTFSRGGPHRIKILIAHHPLLLPPNSNKDLAGNAAQTLDAMAATRADAALTGHLHTTHTATEIVTAHKWHILHAQAGTPTSTRQRGQPPSFNTLRIHQNQIDVHPHTWNPTTNTFTPQPPSIFTRTTEGWAVSTNPPSKSACR